MSLGVIVPTNPETINEDVKQMSEFLQNLDKKSGFLAKIDKDLRRIVMEREFTIRQRLYPNDRMGKIRLIKSFVDDWEKSKRSQQAERLAENRNLPEKNDDNQPHWNINFPDHIPKYTQDIIINIMENICAKGPRGYRYGDHSELVDLAFLIHSKSPAAYDVLLEFCLPFPTPATLYNRFHEEIMMMKKFVLHPELVPGRDGEWAIAIDAIALHNWSSKEEKGPKDENGKEIKYLFIFLGMPLKFGQPNVILHIIEHTNGESGKIIDKINSAIDEINKHIKVRVVITDGDPGYDKNQDRFIEYISQAKNYEEMMSRAKAYLTDPDKIVWINDIIHMSKLERTRLIDTTIKLLVDANNMQSVVDVNKIRECVDIGDALNDTTPLGAIKDKYPIAIFSISVLLELLKKQYINEALFIAPLALWYEAIRSESFESKTRLCLMKFAFQIFFRHYMAFKGAPVCTFI
ncbi:hypothetical protein TVAG_074670 [Trichomonas vaginalis G3]|uniref:Uncharacterized protein n=1 Tax=Trichomonas vaginalis (strain ATCC PRA-98 / G3) TaxID=412133 RepID=A2E3Y4_TRIV3|nr:hypothetical protein TVAG_074670 [Trichomonas vaginalis G3]|eukprot:XP_001324862.1 hypothetical protein [Trichomonas vaginalis G3]